MPLVSLYLIASLASTSPSVPLPGDSMRALSFAAIEDATGDGITEFALGLPRDDAHGKDAGRVFVMDGQSGQFLREFFGDARFSSCR